jgi:predicted dinucleotide-binding enzyme
MRIAVLGAGNVGGTLGRRWAELGHDVRFGVRDPSKGASAVKGGGALPGGAIVTTTGDAVRGADVVLLAAPWDAVRDLLRAAGTLDGVVLLDATNPLKAGMQLDFGPNGESGGEQVQALAPNARVVKIFNTTGFNNMNEPAYNGAATMMLYAGNELRAKQIAHDLATGIGFDAYDAGNLSRARELEYLASLWISLAYGAFGAPALGREFAFRLLRR